MSQIFYLVVIDTAAERLFRYPELEYVADGYRSVRHAPESLDAVLLARVGAYPWRLVLLPMDDRRYGRRLLADVVEHDVVLLRYQTEDQGQKERHRQD